MRIAAFLVTVILVAASVFAATIHTQLLSDTSELSGTYTAILYGKAGYSDPVTVAFLDLEGDDTELVPRAPSFQFSRRTGLIQRRPWTFQRNS